MDVFRSDKCCSSLINVQTYVAVVVGGAVLGGLVAALAVTDGVGGRDCGIGGWRGRGGGGNLTVVVRPRGALRDVWPVTHLQEKQMHG